MVMDGAVHTWCVARHRGASAVSGVGPAVGDDGRAISPAAAVRGSI